MGITKRIFSVAVITLSDKGAKGEREDLAGPLIKVIMEEDSTQKNMFKVQEQFLIPDEPEELKALLIDLADNKKINLILTTGGTGFSPRDCTPEATLAVAERNAFGICEAIRAHSLTITKRAMLSRAVSVIRKQSLIINLPGSPKAVKESLEYVLSELRHGLEILLEEASECAR